MEKILINDLLNIPDCEIGNAKLKLNVFNGNTDPLEEYKKTLIRLTLIGFYGIISEGIFAQDK